MTIDATTLFSRIRLLAFTSEVRPPVSIQATSIRDSPTFIWMTSPTHWHVSSIAGLSLNQRRRFSWGSRRASYGTLQASAGRLIHDEAWETRAIPKPLAWPALGSKAKCLERCLIRPWMVEISDDHYELDTSRARDLLWLAAKEIAQGNPAENGGVAKGRPYCLVQDEQLNAARVCDEGYP